MHSGFRPLLAATIETTDQFEKLNYPMIGSPKVDGVRIVCHHTLGPVTRSLKPVKNLHIRALLAADELKFFDGEVTLGPPNGQSVFNDTIRATQTHDGAPDITYHVFDTYGIGINEYRSRLANTADRIKHLNTQPAFGFVQMLEWVYLDGPGAVAAYEAKQVEAGYEGIMLRHIQGRYKFGRSTLKEQILLKLKRWQDDEAEVIGFEALQRNQNVQTRNNLGLAERSTHKAGKVDDSLLGKLLVSHHTFGRFSIGSGLDVALREEIWNNQEKYLGKQVTFKYMPYGSIDAPRFPIFKCFRDPDV